MQTKPSAGPHAMNENRKTWTWAILVLFLLAIIVVGATLIGVYMNQKHTEAVVEMAFHDKTGEKVQQTVMLNDVEKVAAFYVQTNNVSSTVLYDYNHGLIGFRRTGGKNCYIVKMGDINVPTMSDILKSIKQFQQQNSTRDSDLSYDLIPGGEADRTKLGVPINILCSDVPITWATINDNPNQRWKFSIKFNIFGIDVTIAFES
ncbi:PREDICTED: pulmonary surfactant-associated protein C-like [Nanorana parkeri]|uniref:pulmonary surfactant-associated protein C-like n=1 Tax=Nanorana parkeri TaxID=125878 RepID=UPI0008543253|nr:PREDICTED: pulmonary surfactant-associated protein C-like [Nanorana parkeri]